LPLQTAALVYMGIDWNAWLAMPAAQEDVTRTDFIAWYERYFPALFRKRCPGIEIYAARCGLLHSRTAESRLSRGGRARMVLLAWDNAKASKLTTAIRMARKGREAVVVHLDDLVSAYQNATSAFLSEIENDAALRSRVEIRAQKLFAHQPSDQWDAGVRRRARARDGLWRP
jgi:hypothetical protein